jgi:hypothetical protein
MANPTRQEFSELRNKVDGSDGFMRGSAVFGPRDPFAAGKKFPEWVHNYSTIRQFLRTRFPGLDIPGSRDQRQAGRWLIVIQRHWRMMETAATIEAVLSWKPGTVASIAQQIRWAAAGLRLDGKPHSQNRRGRPKKKKSQDLATPTENVHNRAASYERDYIPAASTA